MQEQPTHRGPSRRRRVRPATVAQGVAFLALAALTAQSAVWAKRHGGSAPPLTALSVQPAIEPAVLPAPRMMIESAPIAEAPAPEPVRVEPALAPTGTRFFDGRPIRPVRTVWMTVTAYSPDWRSCGKFADGITASLKSVHTNGGRLVAADTRLLPMGSLVSVPGYAEGEVVPVLDRGGAIKGKRLDVLYPTHERALIWGVQRIPVTIWEYADGPAARKSSASAI